MVPCSLICQILCFHLRQRASRAVCLCCCACVAQAFNQWLNEKVLVGETYQSYCEYCNQCNFFLCSIQCSGISSLWTVWQCGLWPVVQESASWRVASQPSQVFFLSSLNILFLIVSSFFLKKFILILKHALMKKNTRSN